jgi:hypothetical protein
MGTVEEETDESMYWMELLIGANVVEWAKTDLPMKEAQQLLAIAISSIKTARKSKQRKSTS